MTTSIKHAHPWIFVGPFLLALAACPKDMPVTTEDPDVGTSTDVSTSDTSTSDTPTSDAPTSTTTASTTSGQPGTTTGESTEQGSTSSTASTTTDETTEPDTTSSTTSTSNTTLDTDTTTGGDACELDLSVSLALGFDKCDDELVLIATVHNVGSVDAPAGFDVSFYEGTDNSGIKLATMPTSEPLTPGSSTDVVFAVFAPPMDEPRDYYVEIHDECDIDNNDAVVTDAVCQG